jgi:hypothetical protein
MAEASILKSVKRVLGLGDVTDEFDEDVIMHVNSAFQTLAQLGIGPETGFAIEDDTAQWDSFLGTNLLLSPIKSYIYLRVRLLFDPPTTSFHIASMERQIEQLEWRLSIQREHTGWLPPPTDTTDDLALDGGTAMGG